jgi:hypothetical protein
VATVSDGSNPGRSSTPQRQSPAPKRNGRAGGPSDPTVQEGQLPSEIFGFSQHYSTGAPGSQGATGPDPDVTVQAGQLEEGLSGVTGSEITSTGLDGTQGHSPSAGGEGVRYTDPFGYMGNEHRESHASGQVHGSGDWTAMGDDSGFSGATLPVLEGNRPVHTGAGQGNVTGASHPNAMDGGTQPRNGNGTKAAGPRHPDAGR